VAKGTLTLGRAGAGVCKSLWTPPLLAPVSHVVSAGSTRPAVSLRLTTFERMVPRVHLHRHLTVERVAQP
jgi:hypothetical protein